MQFECGVLKVRFMSNGGGKKGKMMKVKKKFAPKSKAVKRENFYAAKDLWVSLSSGALLVYSFKFFFVSFLFFFKNYLTSPFSGREYEQKWSPAIPSKERIYFICEVQYQQGNGMSLATLTITERGALSLWDGEKKLRIIVIDLGMTGMVKCAVHLRESKEIWVADTDGTIKVFSLISLSVCGEMWASDSDLERFALDGVKQRSILAMCFDGSFVWTGGAGCMGLVDFVSRRIVLEWSAHSRFNINVLLNIQSKDEKEVLFFGAFLLSRNSFLLSHPIRFGRVQMIAQSKSGNNIKPHPLRLFLIIKGLY